MIWDMHWTERELILSRRDVLQDKFMGRRIFINTLLLYWERDLPIFWTKERCPGFVFKRFVIFGLLFFKLESSTLEQSFQCCRFISRNKEKSKIRDTLLGFIIILTLSSNFTKIDWIPANNKLSKDQNSSQSTLPEKTT